MSLLVVGSVALDTVDTPSGHRDEAIGGSASYFSISASHFTPVNLVATVGKDFPPNILKLMENRSIDLKGLHIAEGKTFRWAGDYRHNLNEAKSLKTDLNVFETFDPVLPPEYRSSKYIFLANIAPELQMKVLEQVENPTFIGCDTMNFWINGARDALVKLLKRVDLLSINEDEAKMLTTESNIVLSGHKIQAMGPKYLVIKRGEYGAILFCPNDIFYTPALPLTQVVDPTGAGDSFAGGLMGYLSQQDRVDDNVMKCATIMGAVMASYNISNFSYDAMLELNKQMILKRFHEFRHLVGANISIPSTI